MNSQTVISGKISCPDCGRCGLVDGRICTKCDINGKVIAPLPAAPAPTRNLTFGLDHNGKQVLNNAPAPTELAELPPLPKWIDSFADRDLAEAFAFNLKAYARAALAARQAPTDDGLAKLLADAHISNIACMMGNMMYNLAQKKGHTLTNADCEMFDNLRRQWDAARQVGAPDTLRDAWPEEPTPEMQAAGAQAIRFDTTLINKMWTANAVYRAMRAAIAQEQAP